MFDLFFFSMLAVILVILSSFVLAIIDSVLGANGSVTALGKTAALSLGTAALPFLFIACA
tara:strand:+ start:8893 stop:9072 length:180 start_codon:yes stop_codon:yes gene_type:complete